VESGGSSVDLVSQPQGPTSTTLDGLGDVITQSSAPTQGGGETASTQTTSAQVYAGSAVRLRGIGYIQWFITLATTVAFYVVLS
jgi:hypothetical protein